MERPNVSNRLPVNGYRQVLGVIRVMSRLSVRRESVEVLTLVTVARVPQDQEGSAVGISRGQGELE